MLQLTNFYQNIAAAQKEVERLEKEALESSSGNPKSDTRRRDGRAKKVSAKETGANSDISAEWELIQDKDAVADVADVADDMKKVSIEDKEDAEVAA